MKEFYVTQGSPQWQQLRAGVPTASEFKRILTPTGKLSAQADDYMNKLLAERVLGFPLETISTKAMDTGREREPEALAWFEFDRGVEVKRVGICFTDDLRVGASPDGLVEDHGLLEIKCPNPDTQVGYLLSATGISREYYPQIMGQLWVTERDWLDSIAYCHGFPPAVFRVERDDAYIAKLAAAVTQFADNLDAALERLLALGCRLPEPEVAPERDSRFDITDADVEAILAGKGMA